MSVFFNHLHSYNRYLVLLALVFVLFRAFSGWLGRKPYEKADNIGAAALLGLTHLQVLIGLIQYFAFSAYTTTPGLSMKDPWVRYFKAEHIAAMLIAAALIQIGRIVSKKAAADVDKHRKMATYTAIAALLIIGTLAMKGLLFGSLAAVTSGQ